MRRSPITVGILAAELAMGVAIAAPARADQPSDAPSPTVLPPLRDGRADPASDPAVSDPGASEPVVPDPSPEAPADPGPEAPVEVPAPASATLRTGRVGIVVEPPVPADPKSSSGNGPASSSPSSVPSPGGRSVPTPKVPPVASGVRPGVTSVLDESANAAPVGATDPTGDTGVYQVVAGDNLWEIAARHLAETSGRDRASLSVSEIVGYWVTVCAANREQLRSGNVNLIDPGEVVMLPAV